MGWVYSSVASAQHPLPATIRSHRKLAKLLSTWVSPLHGFARPISRSGGAAGHHRIHTTLHQCNTATGRLSSRYCSAPATPLNQVVTCYYPFCSEPNLQNLPTIRDSNAACIRDAFCASGVYDAQPQREGKAVCSYCCVWLSTHSPFVIRWQHIAGCRLCTGSGLHWSTLLFRAALHLTIATLTDRSSHHGSSGTRRAPACHLQCRPWHCTCCDAQPQA